MKIRFTKKTKKILSFVMAAVIAATTVMVPSVEKKAEAATTYKAYLCLQTAKYTFRNSHDDSKFSNALQNTTNELSSKASKAKFTDTTVKKSSKKATYTVSLTGLKSGVISNDGSFNCLYVDTTIPGSSYKKVKCTKAVVKIDGKKVATVKNPYCTPSTTEPSSGDYLQIQLVNEWNSNVKSISYSMPKKSISVTFTIKFK